jgi:hypothetical protein
VKWASSRLHDSESLEDMVDPGIKRAISSKALSRFADIVCLCIQVATRTDLNGLVRRLLKMKLVESIVFSYLILLCISLSLSLSL